ncbi:MAG: hypothetical protein WBX25_11665 [Rhodomicrobium sp.]
MKSQLRVLAGRCHTDSCCPTIMESETGEEIVIVGLTAHDLLTSRAVTEKVGRDEAAIVIPRDLFLEAVKTLAH